MLPSSTTRTTGDTITEPLLYNYPNSNDIITNRSDVSNTNHNLKHCHSNDIIPTPKSKAKLAMVLFLWCMGMVPCSIILTDFIMHDIGVNVVEAPRHSARYV